MMKLKGTMNNRDEVLNIIKLRIEGLGSQKAFAKQCEISPQYLCDILHKRRNIPDKVLHVLDMKKEEFYFFTFL